MGPIEYNTGVESPFTAALQGYQAGAAVRDDQFKVQQQQAAQQQAVQQRQVINSLITNKNAGAQDYANASLLVPGLREQLKQSWDMKNTGQQESALRDAGQWYAAVANGQPQTAVKLMNERADAMEAANAPPREVQALRANASVIQEHPEFGRTTLGLFLASVPGGDKVLSGATTMGVEKRAADKAPAELLEAQGKALEASAKGAAAATTTAQGIAKTDVEIKNVQSQIGERAKRLALDQDKLTSDVQIEMQKLAQKNGELPEFVAKDINSAVVDSQSAQQSAQRMTTLADKMSGLDTGWGTFGTFNEWLRKTTGNQNELSRMRAEYNRIATPAAMAAYKKVASGSTSDKDIDTAMIGVPKDTADTATVAAFLRGAAKLQTYDSVVNGAKAEWLGANKNLGKSKADQTIDGVQVPAGTTFQGFSDQYVGKKVEKLASDLFLNSLAQKYPSQAAGATGAY